MHDAYFSSIGDFLLIGLPVAVMLVVTVFRLDTIVAAPKSQTVRHSRLVGTGPDGHIRFTDPDDRPWLKSRKFS
jgi:hypothetical protein